MRASSPSDRLDSTRRALGSRRASIPSSGSCLPFLHVSKGMLLTCLSVVYCVRFCEYTAPSVGFVPHRDASFIGGSEERSIFTIMLYLNDEFEDGTTNFLHSHTGGRIDETIDVPLFFLF